MVTTYQALNASQLDYAHELLEEIHPIDDTPFCVAFPWLGVFTMCGVPNYPKYRKDQVAEEGENHGLDKETGEPLLARKKTMLVNGKEVVKKSKKKKKNNVQDQAKLDAEPLARLGFGIVAYTDILWTLIAIFFLFSLMLAPTMSAFHAGTGYANVNPEVVQYELGMIGNMGFSSVQCASIPVSVGKLNIACSYGTIGEILDSGVNQADEQAANCASNDDIKACVPDSASFLADLDGIIGEDSKLLTFGGANADLWTSSATADTCAGDHSRLFVQYSCIQANDVLDTKYKQVSLAVSTGVLICLLFTISIRYMFQGGKMKQIDWDMATITAGDYTVEFDIPEAAYDDWY